MLRRSLALASLALLAACEDSKPPAGSKPAPPGALVYLRNGCSGCHSLDGSRLSGPTFKGLFGSKRTLADGTTVVADEAYLRESIVAPGAKVLQGYPAVMPSYQGQLTDKQIDDLVAYIETLR